MKSYGVLKLTVASPPQSFPRPLTVDEVQTFLRLPMYPPADPALHAQLEMLIDAAREQAEVLQQRPLVAAQYDLTLDAFDDVEIDLGDGLATVDLITYRDSAGAVVTLAEGVDYIADTVRGTILPASGKSWPSFTPWPSSAVTIRYTAAPEPIHAVLKTGLLLLVSSWFENRLPFELGASAVQEYPYAVTSCLSWGAVRRVW